MINGLKKRHAVVLFNLGGPDSLDAVEPFLFNLFYDKAILNFPNPFRYFLAWIISWKRTNVAKKIYKKIGGKSPILDLTQKQAYALELDLNHNTNNIIYKTFVSMRYWHPFSDEVLENIIKFQPDEIILLPLYPQWSTTSSASSILDFKKLLKKQNIKTKVKTFCCYPTNDLFIQAHVDIITSYFNEYEVPKDAKILFSAHGIPQACVDKGDPYQYQIEQTVKAIMNHKDMIKTSYTICYQSKVGRAQWTTPSTGEIIAKAGRNKESAIVIVPVAFVSEHSETLVELDIEYKELAQQHNISDKQYYRIPALHTHPKFIKSLSDICKNSVCTRKCPKKFSQCYHSLFN